MRLFIHDAAEQDILRQIEHYAEQGLSEIAQRFSAGVVTSLNLLIERPDIGAPRRVSHPQLSGLRSWPVKGCEAYDCFSWQPVIRASPIQPSRHR
jgi:plasmid stabilization system protein ParE